MQPLRGQGPELPHRDSRQGFLKALQRLAGTFPAFIGHHVEPARRLEAFKQKLQLSPAQEGAWNTFAASIRPAPMQRPDRAEFARLTTPERIDRMKQMRAQRMAEMDKRADATKTFYATLNPQQQKVFDEATLRMHGGHGHHRG